MEMCSLSIWCRITFCSSYQIICLPLKHADGRITNALVGAAGIRRHIHIEGSLRDNSGVCRTVTTMIICGSLHRLCWPQKTSLIKEELQRNFWIDEWSVHCSGCCCKSGWNVFDRDMFVLTGYFVTFDFSVTKLWKTPWKKNLTCPQVQSGHGDVKRHKICPLPELYHIAWLWWLIFDAIIILKLLDDTESSTSRNYNR